MKRVIEVSIFDQVLMAAVSTAFQVLVSPLLGTLFDSLTSLIQKEVGLVLGVNDELRKLSKTLSTILDVLEDAEDKQITDKSINNWLKDLKDAAYNAEDILDECATEALLTEPPSIMKKNKSHNIQVLFPHSISSILDFKGIKFRRKIGKRIRKLRHRFDEIANERSKFHLNLNLATRGDHVECSKRNQQRETTSFLPEPQVYGRDEEKEHLVNLLLNININPEDINLPGVGDVFVCPILGMGGLGKTTVAQMVHNDERIVKHFEIRSWVCVSEDFDPKTLLKAIIESSCQTPTNLENLDSLQNRLHQILKGKRFLLVLDDVWNEDSTKWYRLKSSLTCGSSGSSIVVTTRLETVASLMSASFPLLRLRALSEKDCFTLFKHRAFDVREHELSTHPNLKEIGKEIVKKCGGVPLAAKALGSLLRFKREESEWLFVRDSKFWELPQTGEGSILPALKLSYNHLPSNLRQCFAYCSIFPKDHKLLKKELIYLWMANCFIQPKGDMHLFDIGNEIFNDLLWRSFFQDVEEDEHGNIMCKMHDLVHDLACSIVANECSIIEVHNAKTRICRNTTRHLSLDFGYSSLSRIILESIVLKFPFLLRTIYQVRLPFMRIIKVPCCLLSFSEFKCMRVLDLSQTNVTSLPEFESSNLKHLRYINLSRTDITSVPESICSLINLQTLKLNECNELQRLPKDMKKMSSLLHLEVSDCAKLTSMPTGLGELIHLQTLTFFYVSPKKSYSDDGGIEELQNLNHLRLQLTIKAISYVGNLMEAKNACLTEKCNLHSLVLCWCGDTVIKDYNSEEEKMVIAEVLQPHQNIRRLSIEGYEGLRLPSWMWDSSFLPNLVYLALVDCCRCQHLPPLGQLPLLKVLKIFELDSVKHIGDEFYGYHQGFTKGSLFRSLEELHFSYMMNLEELSLSSPKGVKQVLVFPCLQNLSIVSCPELRICPPLPPTLHYLNISFCDALKSLSGGLRHLSSLRTLSIKHCGELEFLYDDFQHLTSLRELVIGGFPKLTSLPVVGSEDPTTSGTLEHLELEICPGLTELPKWMARANLTASLRILRIRFCKNLKSLPTGAEQLIISLQTVDIYKCHPDLEQQFMAMRRSS